MDGVLIDSEELHAHAKRMAFAHAGIALSDADLRSYVSRSVRLSAVGLRRDRHGSVKDIHHDELEASDKERPTTFPRIMLI